jgi:hypothetical protein
MNSQGPPPPPIPESEPRATARPVKTFSNQVATFSVLAPAVAIGISVLLQPQVRGNRWAMMILGFASMLLIVLGFVSGIVGLVSAKRHGQKSAFGRAIVGTCIGGLLTLIILFTLPAAMRAAQRAKERQRIEQSR